MEQKIKIFPLLAILLVTPMLLQPVTSQEQSQHVLEKQEVKDEPTPNNSNGSPTTKVPPAYPEKAFKKGIKAQVKLEALLLKDGTLTDLKVLKCSRRGWGFEEAALEAVRQWKYKPQTKDGKPIEAHFIIYVKFSPK